MKSDSDQTMSRLVYERLKNLLNDGKLRPGQFMDLNVLGAELGMSRTPLRDALIRLEAEGFVTVFPRRGVLVNALELGDIRDLYEVIGALEAQAVLSALPGLGKEGIARMRELDASMRRALDDDDFSRYYDDNLRFHDIYLERSGNGELLRTVRTMKERLYDFPRRKAYVREWEAASCGEHAELVRLLESGDGPAAAAYVRDVHWSFAVQEPFVTRYYFALGRDREGR
ncbi:MAG: GntR family transcriptional regulator [Spirochaetes bacterium]|nr:GntR family transcriptional regulator [Spirochaetota bacterium]